MARILLIEDNNDIQEILYSLLIEDHLVLQAFSGTEGLRLFQQEAVDLVLLDIMLPGKNGDQVLEEIRLQSQVPVIMMTALGDKHLISQYLLAGANDYIVKPFNLDEVAARVTVQLRNQFYSPSLSNKGTFVNENLIKFYCTQVDLHVRSSQDELDYPFFQKV